MERRRSNRVPIQVWVEQWTEGEMYVQLSANLSRGGIYLDRTIPHPEGTVVNLRFNLPGSGEPLEMRGRIVFPKSDDEPGMGLEFVELTPEIARIIDNFLTLWTPAPSSDAEGAPEAESAPEAPGEPPQESSE